MCIYIYIYIYIRICICVSICEPRKRYAKLGRISYPIIIYTNNQGVGHCSYNFLGLVGKLFMITSSDWENIQNQNKGELVGTK